MGKWVALTPRLVCHGYVVWGITCGRSSWMALHPMTWRSGGGLWVEVVGWLGAISIILWIYIYIVCTIIPVLWYTFTRICRCNWNLGSSGWLLDWLASFALFAWFVWMSSKQSEALNVSPNRVDLYQLVQGSRCLLDNVAISTCDILLWLSGCNLLYSSNYTGNLEDSADMRRV